MRSLTRMVVTLVVLAVGLELVARFGLGLGDPPLYVADPEIEYLFKPSSQYHRFGHRVAINAYSMRSDEFPAQKQDPQEIRVLFLGDSIINGGNLTDQSELATEILKTRLREALARPVVVGNVSAGSWGPGNLLAYIKRFGLFDADVVVIVISSHDCGDVPTFVPVVGVRPDHPDRPPVLASQELFGRYWKRAWNKINPKPQSPPKQKPPPSPEDEARSLTDLREILARVEASGADLLVLQHLERQELGGHEKPGYGKIRELLRSRAMEPLDDGPVFSASIDAGVIPYRDKIHPNPQGQRLIADLLYDLILTACQARPPTDNAMFGTHPPDPPHPN